MQYERIVPVQKRGDHFDAGDEVYVDRQGLAIREESSDDIALIGLAADAAEATDFTVEVRIPVAQPRDLKVVQCVGTGRQTADGREIVRPILLRRWFRPDDQPDLDRHPVHFLAERDALTKKEMIRPPGKTRRHGWL